MKTNFVAFSLTLSGIKAKSTLATADALSTRPLNGFNIVVLFDNVKDYCFFYKSI